MKREIIIWIAVILSFLFSTCQTKTSPQTIETSTSVSTGIPETLSTEVSLVNGYPVPQVDLSPYPVAEDGQMPPTLITPNPPADAPDPEPGKGSLSGTLYSPIQKMVIPGTQSYLTPGWGEDQRTLPPAFVGPQVDKGDIVFVSDSVGNFTISNVPPGNYYLVVWAPMNWVVAQNSETDAIPLLLEIMPDQKVNLGIVNLSWP